MRLFPVTFELDLPLVDPVHLHLRGVSTPIPMERSDSGWHVTLELPAGTYTYKFSIANDLYLNDPRRSTQRPEGDDLWSILRVDSEEGPLWTDRPRSMIKDAQICRSVSDTSMPLMVIKRTGVEEMPITLWLSIENLFTNAFLHVFLLRPDGSLAFGGEYVLDHEWADAEYQAKFHMAFQVERKGFTPGKWSFMVRSEGGRTVTQTLEIAN